MRPSLVIYNIYKRITINFGNLVFKRSININKSVKFIQKTVLSGKGKIYIDEGVSIGYRIGGGYFNTVSELQSRYKYSEINIGKRVKINNGITIIASDSVNIGEETLIGQDVMILDFDGHGINPNNRRGNKGKVSKVEIGNNVWIGNRVTILNGTEIGNNSVIGAGSVVKGKFPENCVIGGNPAKIIKYI